MPFSGSFLHILLKLFQIWQLFVKLLLFFIHLCRDKLVCVALMTGSHYTEGVETKGLVTALEVLAEFPGEGVKPLQYFRQWSSRVKGEVGKELTLPQASFPSKAVVSAYLSPDVDTTEEIFSWAVPNLVGVRDFAMDRFGWDKSQVYKLQGEAA